MTAEVHTQQDTPTTTTTTTTEEVVVVSQEETPKTAAQEKVVEQLQDVKQTEDEPVNDDPKPKTVQKSSSYKEESNYPSDLKDLERKALNDMKSKLKEAIQGNTLFQAQHPENTEPQKGTNTITLWGVPLLPSEGAEGIDVILLKFLRAREFKVNDAFEMLKKTLQWRKESKIDSILEEDLGSDLSSAAYMNGVDREGHPVCYNIFGVFDSEEIYQKTFGTEEKRSQFLRWRLQLMEKGIQKLNMKPGGVSSLLQINDLKNSPGPAKKELRVATKQALAILQDNYPEMVAKNVTSFFSSFLQIHPYKYSFYSLLPKIISRLKMS